MKKNRLEPLPSFFATEPRWRAAAPWALWGVWAMVVAVFYFREGRTPVFSLGMWLKIFPPFYELSAASFTRHLAIAVRAALFVGIAWGAGRWALLRLFRLRGLNPLETFAFSFLLGTGAVGFGTALLAAVGLLKAPAVWGATALLAAAAVLGFRAAPDTAAPTRLSEGGGPGMDRLLEGWNLVPAFFTGLALAVLGFYALAPEIFYDSLVYHLSLPAQYKLEGRWVATPTNLYSGVPMLMEMVYLWGLFIGDEVLGKLIHWTMGLGISAGMLGLALRRRNPFAGWLACAVFLSTPLVGINLWKTAVDGASAFALFMSASALSLSFYEEEASPARRRLRLLSAVCLGLAMGVKYPNWPALGVAAAVLLFLRTPPRAVAQYVAVCLAFVAPWMVKNLVHYGNPLFPYFNDLFNPGAIYPVDWKGLHADGWGRDWGFLLMDGKALFETLVHPWYMTMKGGSDADFLGPLFLAGLPAVLCLRGRAAESRLWLWLLGGLWLLWWPLTAMPRFFMPGLAFLSLWLALAVDGVPFGWARRTAKVLVMVLALNNLSWTFAIAYQVDAWSYLLRGQTKADYLSRSHDTYPTPYYPSAEWINRNAPQGAGVLVVGDARGYYLERRYRASSVWDTDLFTAWLKGSASEDELRERLRREKVDYLLVNVAEVIRRRVAGLDAGEVARMEKFFRAYCRQVFQDIHQDPSHFRWSLVYEVLPGKTQGGPAGPLAEWHARQLAAAVPAP